MQAQHAARAGKCRLTLNVPGQVSPQRLGDGFEGNPVWRSDLYRLSDVSVVEVHNAQQGKALVLIHPCRRIDAAISCNRQCLDERRSKKEVGNRLAGQNGCQLVRDIQYLCGSRVIPHDDALGSVVDRQDGHDHLLCRRGVPSPEALVAKSLWRKPLSLGPSDQIIAASELVKPVGDVLERAIAIVTATASVCSITHCVVDCRVGRIGRNGVYIWRDDIRALCVLGVVEVVAIQRQGGGVVWVNLADLVVRDASRVDRIALTVWLIRLIPYKLPDVSCEAQRWALRALPRIGDCECARLAQSCL